MTIGDRLREERERLEFSQPAFAGLAETTKKSQIDYEKGITFPKANYLEVIAKVGADVQYIVTGVRSMASLAPMEQLFLERFRGAPKAAQDNALLALMGLQGQPSSAKQIFEASLNKGEQPAVTAKFNAQSVENQIDTNHGAITINKRSDK